MWECEVSVDIEAPIEEVYERLIDFSRHSYFSEGLAKVEQVTPGPAGVGTRFRAEETVPGKFVGYCEITALEKPRRIAWKAWVKGAMRTQWEFRLSDRGTGTHLVQLSRWQPVGPIGFLMLNLHRKSHVPVENQRSLERIKQILESERKEVLAS